MLTTMSDTIVDASASNSASEPDGSRTKTRRAKKLTMTWTIQKTIVASTIAGASAETPSRNATARTIPTKMPASAATIRMPNGRARGGRYNRRPPIRRSGLAE